MEVKKGLTIEEGLEEICNRVCVKDIEEVATKAANGRILAEDIIANENIPPFARSPLDGYALKAEDVSDASADHPVKLAIIEEIPAGNVANQEVVNGTAIKILTGAPIPVGADLVVKYEDTEFTEEEVTFFRSYRSGDNIVPLGEDMKIGDHVCKAGEVITPPVVGLIAGLGISQVKVYQKPQVAYISTGSELVEIDAELAPGKIRNSSVYALKSFIEQVGGETIHMENVEDDLQKISDHIMEQAKKADVIITTGGVSVGDYDYLPRVLEHIGADMMFWKLKLKPGGAFLAGYYEDTLIICLSGNPSAAAVALQLNAVPAVKKMAGRTNYMPERIRVALAKDYNKKSPSMRMIPGKLVIEEGQARFEYQGHAKNGMLSPLRDCDLLGRIEAGSAGEKAGTIIWAYHI